MIKKINTVLFIAIGALILLKVIVDALEGIGGAHDPAAAGRSSSRNGDLAPTIRYFFSETLAEENPLTRRNGPALDIIRAIFPKARFQRMSVGSEKLAESIREDPHAAGFFFANDTRFADLVAAPTPLLHDELVIYSKRAKAWNYEGPESLDQVCLNILDAFLASPVLRRHVERNREHPERISIARYDDDSVKTAVRAYTAGKIDAYVGSNVGLVPYRLGFKADELISTVSSGVIDRLPVAFVVSNADPEYAKRLVEAYERGLNDLKSTGELRRILNYYAIPERNTN